MIPWVNNPAATEKKEDQSTVEGVATGRQRIFSTSLPKGRGDLIERTETPPKEEEESSIGIFFKMLQKKLTLKVDKLEEEVKEQE